MIPHIWHLQDEIFRRFSLQPVQYQNGPMSAKTWIRKGTFSNDIAQSPRASLKMANITVPIENSVDCHTQVVRARGVRDFRTLECPLGFIHSKQMGLLVLEQCAAPDQVFQH
jgi:hypothetical protein